MTEKSEEIVRKYNIGDGLFKQGVELGMKSFDHFITISSAGLGFLLAIKGNLFGKDLTMNIFDNILFGGAVGFFTLAIIASIFRNYYAGYGLIYKSERFISKANIMANKDLDENIHKHFQAKDREENTMCKRKIASWIGRYAFIFAILCLGIFVIFITPTKTI
ncbi:MAG: hypothetical protein Greene101449_83 [Candidatus Peregrinibacteria bacterium Greene1014_49]|nr:MAG: hypothetical protein Greene101449_83 [Candidatus Peregrinibacteria bacterium Greene1014_49]